MVSNPTSCRLLAAFLVLTLATPSWMASNSGAARAQDQPAIAGAAPAADYIRIVDENNGSRVVLETSSRVFKPAAGAGPSVVLVGVMHIGERSYYESLQKYLDAQ